jgi:MFS family permease
VELRRQRVAAAPAVVSAFTVARVLFAPVSGAWSRGRELPVFCGGLLIVAASIAACALAADYGQHLSFRAAGGLGSMFTVSTASLLVRIYAGEIIPWHSRRPLRLRFFPAATG